MPVITQGLASDWVANSKEAWNPELNLPTSALSSMYCSVIYVHPYVSIAIGSSTRHSAPTGSFEAAAYSMVTVARFMLLSSLFLTDVGKD